MIIYAKILKVQIQKTFNRLRHENFSRKFLTYISYFIIFLREKEGI